MGAVPNFVNKDFLPPAWRESMKTITSPPLCTANCEAQSVEGMVPLLVSMGDLREHTGFGVVQSLVVDVLLETTIIDCCIQGIFPLEHMIVPRHSRSVEILSTQKNFNEITAENEKVDSHMIADRGNPREQHYLCHVERQNTIPAYSQAPVLVSCCGAGLMTIDTHRNVAER